MTNLMFPGACNLRVVFSRLLTAAFRTGVVIAVFSQVGPVQAQIIDWSNTTGSPSPWYDVGGNWAGGAAPASTQTARFNSANTYQVWWDNITASTTPAVGFLQVNSGNVTFLNNGGFAQHLFTINGSGGVGESSDFSISGASTLATIRGLHFQSLGGGRIVNGGTLTLDGSHAEGSRLTVAGSTGFDVSGNLNVQSGGIFENTVGLIGFNSGSTGVATVTGSGSQWNNSNNFFVGHSGSGTLNVEAGGLVSNTNGFIGFNSGSTGVATVTGSGSQWNSNFLEVGRSGNGTLNVQAGGLVSNTSGFIDGRGHGDRQRQPVE